MYCRYPFRAVFVMTRKRTLLMVSAVWLVSLLSSSLSIYTKKRDIIFDSELFRCVYDRTERSTTRIFLTVVFTVVPLLGILTVNLITCCIAVSHNRNRGKRSTKAFVTVTSVSVIVLLTVIPFVAYCLITAVVVCNIEQWTQLKQLSGYIFYINMFSNPIVYTITNSRFYRFVRYKLLPCLGGQEERERMGNRAVTRRSSSFFLRARKLSTVVIPPTVSASTAEGVSFKNSAAASRSPARSLSSP